MIVNIAVQPVSLACNWCMAIAWTKLYAISCRLSLFRTSGPSWDIKISTLRWTSVRRCQSRVQIESGETEIVWGNVCFPPQKNRSWINPDYHWYFLSSFEQPWNWSYTKLMTIKYDQCRCAQDNQSIRYDLLPDMRYDINMLVVLIIIIIIISSLKMKCRMKMSEEI